MVKFAPRVNLDNVQEGPIYVLNSFPFDVTVNSAWRSYPHEIERGRTGSSSHCKGLAIDLACTDSNMRLRIVSHLLHMGVTRIGIAKSFIHFDLDVTKPDCIWLY